MTERRRLAAIMAADVVGYSRLMGRDEAGTLARLRAHRLERLEPILARRGGRIVKLTGDGALIEFASAVEAVSAAIEFQQAMADANAGVPEETAIVFRIGAHLGDLIVEGDDLYGDGVNIAARLEAQAQPGGIMISGDVYNAVAGRLKAALDDLGDLTLKNIERPIRTFRVTWRSEDWPVVAPPTTRREAPGSSIPAARPDKPSILVPRFVTAGATREEAAMADGISESLATDLSRQSGLTVVSGASSSVSNGASPDFGEMGRASGVRYVVGGSVRFGAGRVRLNVQLISADDSAQLWANRFDTEIADPLATQDEISERASRELAVQIREAEIRRGAGRPGEGLDSSTLFLLARRAYLKGASRANFREAAALYAEAIALDGRNPLALALLSITRSTMHLSGWSDSAEDDLKRAIDLRDRARQLDPHLPYVDVATAWILMGERRFADALKVFERVAQAAPLAGGNAFANVAVAKNNVGRSEEALTELLRVIRVTPSDPQMDVWHYYLGITYAYLGRYRDAAEAFRHSIALNPDFDPALLYCAAVSAQLGQLQETKASVARALSLGARWTVGTIGTGCFSGIGVGIDDARMRALWDGLRTAGLPE